MAVFSDGLGQSTVLIVDDAVPNRILLKKALSGDYRTLEAADGREALQLMRAEPDISLVILDIMMPVLDGYGVLENMRKDEELSKIPVVIVTASEDMHSQIKAFDLGAVDVIIKPFNPQIILHRVHNIISRRESERLAELNREYERSCGRRNTTSSPVCTAGRVFIAMSANVLKPGRTSRIYLSASTLTALRLSTTPSAQRRATGFSLPSASCCAG